MNLTPSITWGKWFRPFSFLRRDSDQAADHQLGGLPRARALGTDGAVPDGGEHVLDRIRGPRVVPVLSREAFDRQARLHQSGAYRHSPSSGCET